MRIRVKKIDKIYQEVKNISKNIILTRQELLSEINELKKQILIINKSKIINPTIKELKIENIELPSKIIIKSLNLNSIKGDLIIFKQFYIGTKISNENNNMQPPIQCVCSRKYTYWDNGKWNDDMDGYIIAEILSKNIQQCYLKVNFLINLNHNIDQFILNQAHIHKLSDEKYKRLLIREIRNYIKNFL